VLPVVAQPLRIKLVIPGTASSERAQHRYPAKGRRADLE